MSLRRNFSSGLQVQTYQDILGIGNFEIDTNADGLADGWTKESLITPALSTDSKFGDYSQAQTTTGNNYYIYHDDLTTYANYLNHKIYFSGWVKEKSGNTDHNIGFNILHGVNFALNSDVSVITTTSWQQWGLIATINSSTNKIRYIIGGTLLTSNTIYHDGVMAIDLTALYGAGNEPSAIDCNTIFRFSDELTSQNFSKTLKTLV